MPDDPTRGPADGRPDLHLQTAAVREAARSLREEASRLRAESRRLRAEAHASRLRLRDGGAPGAVGPGAMP